MSDPPVQVERAPAKLTLSLRITGIRSDGYHEIDAVMVSLELADVLTFEPGDGMAMLRMDGTSGDIPVDDSNLVARALRAVQRSAKVTVEKRIPPGGGLGGGSTDAAAVLRWAGVTSTDVALTLGADVPFCVTGGAARVRGVGEQLTPCKVPATPVVLLTPPFGVPTAAVYRAWDELGGPASEGPNDLEDAALHVEPRLAAWKDELERLTGEPAVLAGSGSTWFSVRDARDGRGGGQGFTDREEELAARLRARGAVVTVTRTSPVPLATGGG